MNIEYLTIHKALIECLKGKCIRRRKWDFGKGLIYEDNKYLLIDNEIKTVYIFNEEDMIEKDWYVEDRLHLNIAKEIEEKFNKIFVIIK